MAHNRQRELEGMAKSGSVDPEIQGSTVSAVSPGAWTGGHRVSPDPDTDAPPYGASVPGSDGARCTPVCDTVDTTPSSYSAELVRLGSFSSWPANHPINPRTLAKAGLYYSGENDVVVCFSCHGQLSGWNGIESPAERHFREHQNCVFARKRFEKERESKESFDDADSMIRLTQNLHCTDSSLSPFQRENISSPPIDDKKKHEFIRTNTSYEDTRNCSTQHAQDRADYAGYAMPSSGTPKQDFVNVSYIHTSNPSGKKTWTGAGAVSVRMCGPDCPKALNTEIHRIHTYFGWPDNVPVTPEQLAKLGFFYLGVRDKVECAFCGGVLHQWEKGDDPKVEHTRHYPHCPFMRNCATSNVPLGSGQWASPTRPSGQWNNFAAQGHQQTRYTYGQVEGVNTKPREREAPKHPELASEEMRYSTYFRWPLYCPISPRKLAQAGFYYTYIDDQVKCFWCDGGLKDWQTGDDPWTEHARWYGEECGFVLSMKGLHYVRSIKDSFPTLAPQVENVTAEQSWQHQYVGGVPLSVGVHQQSQNNTNQHDQYDQLFLDAMDSRVVRNVLEMGFAQSDVETAVHRRLKSNGQPFTTMTDLVECLIALEENGDSDDSNQRAEDKRTSDGKDQEPSTQAAEEPSNSDVESREDGQPESVELLRRKLQQLREERTCKICMTNDACMVFIPCGHLCCCNSCANTMRKRGSTCPLCRARIKHVQRAFLA